MSSEAATVIHMDDGKGKAPAVAAGGAGERGPSSSSSSYATAPTRGGAGERGSSSTRGGAGERGSSSSSSSYATAPTRSGGGLPWLLRSGTGGSRGCLGAMDLLLRVAGLGPTLAAAISTGTADETLSVFTRLFQFHARFDDVPAFTLLLAGNAVAAGYLALSLPFSAAGVVVRRPSTKLQAAGGVVRLLLLACDLLVMALLAAAGGAAAAVAYVAHAGNRRAGWAPICMQFHGFCQRTSGAVVASFLAVLVFLGLVLMAAYAYARAQGKDRRR